MSDQPKDDPQTIACPKCSDYMIERNFMPGTFGIFTRADVRVPLPFTPTSDAIALVCDNCGYAEIYATNPEKLRELAKPLADS